MRLAAVMARVVDQDLLVAQALWIAAAAAFVFAMFDAVFDAHDGAAGRPRFGFGWHVWVAVGLILAVLGRLWQ